MATRRIVNSDELPHHHNPIPAAVVIGNMILPSVISGHDPAGGIADDPAAQIHQAFVNMENVIKAAGGTTKSIAKVIVYLKDFNHRELVNREWIRIFPNESDRAARHVMKADLQGKSVIQMDVIGVLEK